MILADFTPDDVDTFIDKWCLAAEESIRKDSSEAANEAAKAASDLQARLARTPAVMRIATNPLLASILCIVHRFQGRSVPEHRVTLYEKCTDALLYEWDRAKFPENSSIGELDAPAKRILLAGLAAKFHEEKLAEMPVSEVQMHFARCLPDLKRPAKDAISILTEIRDRSGILMEKRPGFYGFAHLSFQEYLTALEYVRKGRTRELAAHCNDRWWHEPTALVIGTPGRHVEPLMQALLNQPGVEAGLLVGLCLVTATELASSTRRLCSERLKALMPLADNADSPGVDIALRFGGLGPSVIPILSDQLHKDPKHPAVSLALLATRSELALPLYEAVGNPLLAPALGHFFPRSEKARTLEAKLKRKVHQVFRIPISFAPPAKARPKKRASGH